MARTKVTGRKSVGGVPRATGGTATHCPLEDSERVPVVAPPLSTEPAASVLPLQDPVMPTGVTSETEVEGGGRSSSQGGDVVRTLLSSQLPANS